MKIVRFLDHAGAIQFGSPAPDGGTELLRGDLFSGFERTGATADVRKILAPVSPMAILCVGLNYRQHAAETGAKIPEFPVLFTKGINTVQNPGDPIEIPVALRSDQVDYECELAVIIGRRCKNASLESALDYVAGYTCANDVSARDWQKQGGGGQWCRGKTFDTFCPLGPYIVTPDDIPDPNALAIRTLLNGAVVQEANTDDMIFPVARLIEFLSGSTTLLPGTVILTGTPHGVGMARNPPLWLKPGDSVTVEIEKVGSLTNPVGLELLG